MREYSNTKRKASWLVPLAAFILTGVAGNSLADPKPKKDGLNQRVDALEAAQSNTDGALGDLAAADAELVARIDALEAFVQKLHRNSSAVVEFDTGGGSSVPYTQVDVTLDFCTREGLSPLAVQNIREHYAHTDYEALRKLVHFRLLSRETLESYEHYEEVV